MGCGFSRCSSRVSPAKNTQPVPATDQYPSDISPSTSANQPPSSSTTAAKSMPPLKKRFLPPPQTSTMNRPFSPLSVSCSPSLPYTRHHNSNSSVNSTRRLPTPDPPDLLERAHARQADVYKLQPNHTHCGLRRGGGVLELVGSRNLSDSFPSHIFDKQHHSPFLSSIPPHLTPSLESYLPLPTSRSSLQVYATQSQVEFFAMLDKKIEEGPDCSSSSYSSDRETYYDS